MDFGNLVIKKMKIKILIAIIVCVLFFRFTSTTRQTKVEIVYSPNEAKTSIINNSNNHWRLINSIFIHNIDYKNTIILTFEK